LERDLIYKVPRAPGKLEWRYQLLHNQRHVLVYRTSIRLWSLRQDMRTMRQSQESKRRLYLRDQYYL